MAFTAKTKRILTRPVLKFGEGVTHHVKIEAPMFIGKKIVTRTPKAGDEDKEPATLINVVNLESGEQQQIVANTVLKSVLTEEYPNDGYVGKCFSITKQPKAPGKAYNPFNIVEIEDPTQDAAEVSKPHRK